MSTPLFKHCEFTINGRYGDIDFLKQISDLGFKIVELEPALVIEKDSASHQSIFSLMELLQKSISRKDSTVDTDNNDTKKTRRDILQEDHLSTEVFTQQQYGGPSSLQEIEEGKQSGISHIHHDGDTPMSENLVTHDLEDSLHEFENLNLDPVRGSTKSTGEIDRAESLKFLDRSLPESPARIHQMVREMSDEMIGEENIDQDLSFEMVKKSSVANIAKDGRMMTLLSQNTTETENHSRGRYEPDPKEEEYFSAVEYYSTTDKGSLVVVRKVPAEHTPLKESKRQVQNRPEGETSASNLDQIISESQNMMEYESSQGLPRIRNQTPKVIKMAERDDSDGSNEERVDNVILIGQVQEEAEEVKNFQNTEANLTVNEDVSSMIVRNERPVGLTEDGKDRDSLYGGGKSLDSFNFTELKSEVDKVQKRVALSEIQQVGAKDEAAKVERVETSGSEKIHVSCTLSSLNFQAARIYFHGTKYYHFLKRAVEVGEEFFKLDFFQDVPEEMEFWRQLKRFKSEKMDITDRSYAERIAKTVMTTLPDVKIKLYGSKMLVLGLDSSVDGAIRNINFLLRFEIPKESMNSSTDRLSTGPDEKHTENQRERLHSDVDFGPGIGRHKHEEDEESDEQQTCMAEVEESYAETLSVEDDKHGIARKNIEEDKESDDQQRYKAGADTRYEEPLSDEDDRYGVGRKTSEADEESDEQQRYKAGADMRYEEPLSDEDDGYGVGRKTHEADEESDEQQRYKASADMRYQEPLSDEDDGYGVGRKTSEADEESDEQQRYKASADMRHNETLPDEDGGGGIERKTHEEDEESEGQHGCRNDKAGADMKYNKSESVRHANDGHGFDRKTHKEDEEPNEPQAYKVGAYKMHVESFADQSLSKEQETDAKTVFSQISESDLSDASSSDGPLFYTGPYNGLRTRIHAADITKIHVDAIVSSTDSTLSHVGSVAKAIAKAAGPALEQDCQTFLDTEGVLDVTDVFVSDGGNLPAKYVLHATGPFWYAYIDKEECANDIRRTVLRCLLEAGRLGLTSLALPSISAAAFGVPKDICAKSYMDAVKHLDAFKEKEFPSPLKEIHFVDVNDEMVNAIQEYFMNHWKKPWDSHLLEKDFAFSTKHLMAKESGRAVGPKAKSGFMKDFQGRDFDGSSLSKKTLYPSVQIYERGGRGQSFPKELAPAMTKSYQSDEDDSETEESQLKKSFQSTASPGQRTKSFPAHALLNKRANQFRNTEMEGASGTASQRETVSKSLVNEDTNSDKYRIRDLQISVSTKPALDFEADIIFIIGTLFSELSSQPVLKAKDCMKKCDDMPEQENAFKFRLLSLPDQTDPQMLCMLNQIPVYPEDVTQVINKFEAALKAATMERKIAVKSVILTSKLFHLDQSTSRGMSKIVCKFATSMLEWLNKASIDSQLSTESVAIVTSETTKPIFIKVLDSAGVKKTYHPPSPADRSLSFERKSECPICTVQVSSLDTLPCCGKHLCTLCQRRVNHCPHCRQPFKTSKGKQPLGTMDVSFLPNHDADGYQDSGVFEIYYEFPDGFQGMNDPNPGRKYCGTGRTAYVPATQEGLGVLKLLRLAFLRGLTFKVGTSVTTGKKDVVIWGDIPHKTKLTGGGYGYPDPGYLIEVIPALADKGVTQSSINSEEKVELECFTRMLRRQRKFVDS